MFMCQHVHVSHYYFHASLAFIIITLIIVIIYNTAIMRALLKSNLAILSQKIALLDLLVAKHGATQASDVFQKKCPIVGASIGQHYRHSMDHVELAALVASSALEQQQQQLGELHYDLRVRGGTLEKDLAESRKRLSDVTDVFTSLNTAIGDAHSATPVTAYFNLSVDDDGEIGLPSTIERELGFTAHHAIHHLAMVRIICLQTIGLSEDELPQGFGRAPSTILFDRRQK
jgi:hypothetical protein